MTELLEGSEVYNKLDKNLKKLLDDNGRVTDKEISDKRDLANNIIESLLTIMKEIDPLFASMNPEPQSRDSVGNQLKVCKPNEFDMDVILNLPIKKEQQNAPKHVHVRMFCVCHCFIFCGSAKCSQTRPCKQFF